MSVHGHYVLVGVSSTLRVLCTTTKKTPRRNPARPIIRACAPAQKTHWSAITTQVHHQTGANQFEMTGTVPRTLNVTLKR